MDQNQLLHFLSELTRGGISDFLRIHKLNPGKSDEELFFLLLKENKTIANPSEKDDLFNKITVSQLADVAHICKPDLALLLFFIISMKVYSVRDGFYYNQANGIAVAELISALVNQPRFMEVRNTPLGFGADVKVIQSSCVLLMGECKKLEKSNWFSRFKF